MGLAVLLALVGLSVLVVVAVIYGVCIGVARVFRPLFRALQPASSAPRSAAVLGEAARRRCWEVKGCKPEARDRCPAFLNQSIPCWRATMWAGGKLRAACLACPQFSAVGMVEGGKLP